MFGATALASVMAAGAAQAEMSIGGFTYGHLSDGGNGLSQTVSTNSLYVSYSDSLDNGMGVSAAMSIYSTNILTAVSVDTGMGVISVGNGRDSAVDKNDGNPACFSLGSCGSAELMTFNDGDTVSGNSIMYTNSVGGLDLAISRGMEGGNVDPVMSYVVGTSVMGASIKGGVSSIDYKDSTADVDPSFMTVSYSIAGLNLGYGMYDNDNGSEETTMGVGTSMGGFDLGIQFADLDAGTDQDMMEVSINKGMGAASFGLDYTDTDVAGTDTGDSENWRFSYVIGF
tara:strand:+ start:63 stop:914 length:852 start_codon:yes stop_codon:yes gene_type:complete